LTLEIVVTAVGYDSIFTLLALTPCLHKTAKISLIAQNRTER